MDFGTMVDKYLRLRDKVDEIKEGHKAELSKYNVVMGTLSNMMLAILNENNAESMRAEAGTAYMTTRSNAKVEDWQQVLAFIRENDAWDLLEHRVSKLALEEIIKETQQSVPGVAVTRETTLNVRRS